MKLETWNISVQVTVDREALGAWTPADVAQEIDSMVSQMEGIADVKCEHASYAVGTDKTAVPRYSNP